MIRRTVSADHDALLALATASGLFEPEQTSMLADLLNVPGESDVWFTYATHDTAVGVAYLAPEKMTHGTWNLYWIAVHPEYQRKGIGKEILSYVEGWLIDRQERILLVETAHSTTFESSTQITVLRPKLGFANSTMLVWIRLCFGRH